MSPVTARTLDFTNVKESSGINPKHLEEGEYLAKIVSVSEQDAKDGTPMWLFVITPEDHRNASYPYYCKLQDNQLWKVRNLFIAAGLGKLVAGAKKAKIDPNKVVGKNVGIILEDDEYEGKMKSVIEAVIPVTDLEETESDEPEVDDDDEEEEVPVTRKRKSAPVVEDDEDDEEEEEEAPAPKKRKAKAKPAPVEEDDEDDEEEEEAPAPKRKRKAKAAPVVEEDEDDEDEEDEPEEKPVSKRTAARRAAKAKAAAPAEDDEDDDLDLDDL